MTNFIYIILITLLFSSCKSETPKEEIIKSLQEKLDDMKYDYVYREDWYIRDVITRGEINYYKFKVEDFTTIIQNNQKIPQMTKDKIKGIIFSKSLTFQGLSTHTSLFIGSLEQNIGIARNKDGVVDVVLISTLSSGQIVLQNEKVTQKKCQSFMIFWQTCQNNITLVPRGFTPSEINLIQNILLFYAKEFTVKLVQNLKEQEDYSDSPSTPILTSHSPTDPNDTLQIQSNSIYDLATHGVLDSQYDNYFINLLVGDKITNNKKLSELERKVKVEIYENIKRADLVLFSLIFINKFSKEVYNIAKYSLDESLFKINNHNRNEIIRLILPENKKLTFYEIMINYCSIDDDYDFEIRRIEIDFDLLYNLVLMKNGNETRYVYSLVKQKKIVYEGELNPLISILEIISQKKSEEVRKSMLQNGKQSSVKDISTEHQNDQNISILKDSGKINSLRFLKLE